MGLYIKEISKSAANRLNYVERTMRSELKECFETYDKIRRIDKLPTLSECRVLINTVDWRFGPSTYASLLLKNDYFQIVHHNLVRDVARLIKAIEPENSVEIAAGKGKISYWLNKRGVPILATDSGETIKSKWVERLNHKQALKKYNPDFVLVSSPPTMQMVVDIMRHESVKHVIVLKKAADLLVNYKRELKRFAQSVDVLRINTYPSVIDSLMGIDKDKKGMNILIKGGKERGLNNLYKSILVTTKRK
ncbi:MAG: hypothetical protein KGH53_00210 [Candidatus Micrarchaeota archaeon]|nr:hypothetical protein [Candidatus Micrarchaeota archaeon]